MSHALIEDVEFSAAWKAERLVKTNEERYPQWYAHMRECERCARNYLKVPAHSTKYCAAGVKVRDL